MEMDVVGWEWEEVWVVESKYWERKVGLKEVEGFCERVERVRGVLGEGVRLWYFSRKGFTEEAEAYMRERGILHSDEEQLNRLLKLYGLRELPEM